LIVSGVQFCNPPAFAILARVNVRLREFLEYHYKCPRAWLRTLREIEPLVARSRLPYKVRSLRTHSLRRWNETRQAALFAYGMSQRVPDFQFDFAYAEHADYDAVIRWRRGNEQFFTPLQLKEYVPEDLNPRVTLQEIFEGLTRYSDSGDLVVAIFLNRRFRLVPGPVPCAPLKLGGVYLVGAATPDQSHWHLIGDLLDESGYLSTFLHP